MNIPELLAEGMRLAGYKLFHIEYEAIRAYGMRLRVEEDLRDEGGNPRFRGVLERLNLTRGGGTDRHHQIEHAPGITTGTFRLDGRPSPIKRPRAVIVLQALLAGVPVLLGRHTFELRREGDAAQLLASCLSFGFGPGGGEKEVLVATNLEVGHFVTLCERLTDDEVFWIGARCALAETARERAAGAGR